MIKEIKVLFSFLKKVLEKFLFSFGSPYMFHGTILQSGFFENKSLKELGRLFNHIKQKMGETEEELGIINKDIKEIRSILTLYHKVPVAQIRNLPDIKKKYPTFFDDDSENDTSDGLGQVKDYLYEEKENLMGLLNKHKDSLSKIKAEIDNKNAKLGSDASKDAKQMAESSKNVFMPVITVCTSIFFRLSLTILSFSIYFNLISFDFFSLNIPDIIIPAIF